jgi:hypothetical protein
MISSVKRLAVVDKPRITVGLNCLTVSKRELPSLTAEFAQSFCSGVPETIEGKEKEKQAKLLGKEQQPKKIRKRETETNQ